PARLSAMAARYGVSRERIRQLKERCLFGLRTGYTLAAMEESLKVVAFRHHHVNFEPLRSSQRDMSGIRLMTHKEQIRLDPDGNKLTERQQDALQMCIAGRRVAVSGCVGSGKSLLAINLALRHARAGKKTLLTCFNRALADYLSSLLSHESNLTVVSFHALCLRHATIAALPIPGGWSNRVWSKRFPELLVRAVDRREDLKFDTIIVDDAQDLKDNWWSALESSLKCHEGSSLFYFFEDNQLVGIRARTLPQTHASIHLDENLRSPRSIMPMIAANHYGLLPMQSGNPACDLPEFFLCQTADEVRRAIAHVFDDLVTTYGIEASDIAVLTPNLPKLSLAFGARLKHGSRLVLRYSEVRNHALLSRIGTFKGLERKAIILTDLDAKFVNQPGDERALMIYQALSRCSQRLVLIGSSEGWKFLSEVARKPYGWQPLPAAMVSEAVRVGL
ncbi:MAG: hypothetical protein K8F91_26365, partial [Candidatus Obscuribacterales bacterium]|nr:hypothetical protein [Candidatus Obscuribacterales bacterium]